MRLARVIATPPAPFGVNAIIEMRASDPTQSLICERHHDFVDIRDPSLGRHSKESDPEQRGMLLAQIPVSFAIVYGWETE